MKKLILMFIIISLLTFGCKKEDKNNTEKEKIETTNPLSTIYYNNETINLKENDTIEIIAWGEDKLYFKYNKKRYDGEFSINNIKINTSINDVIKFFSLDNTNTIINAEIPTEEHDGTTSIIEDKLTNEFLSTNSEYLNAILLFGYDTKNNYKSLTPKEIKDYYSDKTNKEGILMYQIDICGKEKQELVSSNNVAAIKITLGE